MTQKELAIREKTIFDGVFTKYFLKFIFSVWFKISGWQIHKIIPEGAGVAIAAPHTSNWDFVYALGAAILQDVKIYFSVKESLCRVPLLGAWMMYLGAIPINRTSKGTGQVQLIKNFIESQKFNRVFFLFTPEGTRGSVTKWKTGFYYVAKECNLPIFLAKVDYLSKEVGVFHTFTVSQNKENDIKTMQAAYSNIHGKFLANQYPQYTGNIPQISVSEFKIINVLYSAEALASKRDIIAKVEAQSENVPITVLELSINSLLEKGLLESSSKTFSTGEIDYNAKPSYQLTFAGRGCYLHLSPSAELI